MENMQNSNKNMIIIIKFSAISFTYITTGIIIVISTIINSIIITLFFIFLIFPFIFTVKKYSNTLITFELSILNVPVSISPVKPAIPSDSSSGTDVAIPAIFPTVFDFKFRLCANFRSVVANIFLDIITIKIEQIINFKNIIIIKSPIIILLFFYFFILNFIYSLIYLDKLLIFVTKYDIIP